MKYIVTLSVLFVAQFAFSAPKVGDDAVYDMSEAGQSLQNERTITGVDLNSNQCAEQWSVVGNHGSTTSDVDQCSNMDFSPYTPEHCAQVGGQITQTTVPAGTFTTCQVATENGGFVNIGNVPFGIVFAHAYDQQSQQMVTIQLHSYRFGAR